MEIDTLISNQNPQWFDSSYLPKEVVWPKRLVFEKILPWLDKRFIVALTGLRRVGKSTIQKQIIGDLIKKNKGRQCFYFSFEKLSQKRQPHLIKKIIDWYLHKVLFKKIYQLNEKIYVFFDEVQNIPQWQEVIKFYYDQNENFKFIISGSNSLFIRKKSRESLGGRIIEINIPPLYFKEFLLFKKINLQVLPENDAWISSNIDLLNSYFEKYLRFNQFPEVISEGLTDEQAITYLELIEEKITQQDLPKIFFTEYPEALLAIFNQIKTYPGQRIEYKSMAKDIGIDQRTLVKYIDYLKRGFLISLCYNFGKKPIKGWRIAKKAYLTSSNFAFSAPLSLLVENYVFNILKEKYKEVFFQKENEIDFVAIDYRQNIFVFEVKYQNKIERKDLKNIENFIKKKEVKKAILITKNSFDLREKIKRIPASLIEFFV